ncbi:MAG: TonB-dependent receptor [Bacteroidales bacterium]|jgi:outer membrane receptor protein involved in Fe transport|nr:TonB-dependent receptor [Bacteroidales bacterium]
MSEFIETYRLTGIIIGITAFLIIGIFHPLVVKGKCYFGVKCWWVFLLLGIGGFSAQATELDTVRRFDLEGVVISSTKETNELRRLPGSVSIITPRMLNERRIMSIVDLSTVVPNFFIPNYGSKMSTPVYIRGIGERSTGQSIGLYVDNMPYLDKSVFNFEFLDVKQIEVLRGPQGTLYGRNAMSGVINIHTHSPLDEDRTRLTLSAGNYGLFRANTSISKKLFDEHAGISLSGYFDGNNGFFENQYDGKSADRLRSGGGRLRFDWQPADYDDFTIQWITNYDYSNQGAFPYGIYTKGDIELPNYDYTGKYIREIFSTNINMQAKTDRFIMTMTIGLQHFNDNMNMDLDYTPLSYFTLNQKQKETNLTQEYTLKSNTKDNLKWIVGAFLFTQESRTNVVTTMGRAGIDSILQPILNSATAHNPNAPSFVVTDDEIPIPGTFKTPANGIAIFGEATINNLRFKGLSFTKGVRLDYEKTSINYNTSMLANINVIMPPMGNVIPQPTGTTLIGEGSMSFTEFLPKFALKYEFNDRHYVYFSSARGYKAGGYNIQMFADIVQDIVSKKRNLNSIPQESQDSILPLISYKPEYSWNHELGFKSEILKHKLYAEAAVFYIDVNNILITQFVQSGQGRMLKNAGRAKSTGVELKLTAHLTDALTLSANYGFTRAVFKDYKTGTTDFSGNFIPFAPQNTFSLAAGYTRGVRNSRIIDRFNIHAQYNGAGKIYWTEANDVYQNFYGLLNLKAGVGKGIFGMNIWTRNTLNTDYTAFYFESMGRQLGQRGAPFQIGIDLTMSF